MKTLFTVFGLMVALAGATAEATGLKRVLYQCQGGSGEAAAAITVVHLSGSAPGGPMWEEYKASASQSWLGGTHHSGEVTVKPVIAMDGGPQNYINQKAGFFLTIHRTSGVNPDGRAARALVSATFVDPRTGMQGQIPQRWLPCR